MTEILLIFLAAAVLVLAMRQEQMIRQMAKEPEAETPEPSEEEKLPMKVCRKSEPTIEEQIINLALYNGEDQRGGESE